VLDVLPASAAHDAVVVVAVFNLGVVNVNEDTQSLWIPTTLVF
jgi:hypothetical protein